ncbi:nuclear transport factor 2 family protein [Parvibaculum sp.]|uniref:nuclear transport factor 2 family protein n=1 Tax=Parvibaculum sp. TaxID=2024848 RepID=UPI00320DBAE1
MTEAAHVADRYIAVWNETDSARRMALLAEGWSDDATYVDPQVAGKGHNEIAALIGAVHERFPTFRFALDGRPDGYAGNIRFSWVFGPEAEPDMIKGTDFAVIEGDRLKSITGFLDKIPSVG